jgi:hypothetical protein
MTSNKVTLGQVADALHLQVLCGTEKLNRGIDGGYTSDLLSDVIAHAKKDDIWITLQIHSNIVAVAVLKEIAGVIFVNGREPDDETVNKAQAEGIPLLTSTLTAYELSGKLYELGIHGQR